MHFSSKVEINAQRIDYCLKLIIDFANHFRSAEYGTDCQLNLSKTN